MAYLQIVLPDGQYLGRDTTLAPSARVKGYPGYIATAVANERSIRTILYEENDYIYLDKSKAFMLVSNDGLIWTSMPAKMIEPVKLSMLGKYGITYRLWNDVWANQATDSIERNDLIWGPTLWQQAWTYALSKDYLVAFNHGNEWIATSDSFGGDNFVNAVAAWRTSPISWKPVYSDTNGLWAFRYPGMALANAEQLVNNSSPQYNLWIKGWQDGQATRWLFTNEASKALYFTIVYTGNNTYKFSYGDRHLAKGGSWQVRPWPSYMVSGGVEFFNGSSERLIIANIINPSLSDLDRYLLGQDIYFALWQAPGIKYPMWKPENIIGNMSKGTTICTTQQWDGTQLQCYDSNIPYTPVLGSQLCTTLEDFANDNHCRLWAQHNKSASLDTMMNRLCSAQYEGTVSVQGNNGIHVDMNAIPYKDICSCYWPEQAYYNAIMSKSKNRVVADAVKSTNLLQCASGLCTPDGSFSPSIYYREGRRCDICIQSLSADLSGAQIGGSVDIRGVCTMVDITYIWEDLIERLKGLGVAQIVQNGKLYTITGQHKNLIINKDISSISIISSSLRTPILQHYSLLRSLPKDNGGNHILSRDTWSKDGTRYSSQILAYFLETRGL